MTHHSRAILDPESTLQIHARLLAGDPTAPVDLVVAFLDPLTTWLRSKNPRLRDPHACDTAAEDALLSLIKNPNSYHPERQSLEAYLRMAAKGDLLNLLARERRHENRRANLEIVELSSKQRKYLWDVESDPVLAVVRDAELNDSMIVLPNLTPTEKKALALMHDGERKTAAYAVALEITHLPLVRQRREVKRVKDRLKKRIARSGGVDV